MAQPNSDILVEVPDSQLPELATLYKEKATWAPYMYGFISTAIKWKKSLKYKDAVKIYSPDNCWQEDGTIVAVFTVFSQDFYFFTLDDSCKNLDRALSCTKRFTYGTSGTLRTLFYAVHEKHIPTIKKHLRVKNITPQSEIPCYFYVISPEEARKYTIECPPDVYVKKLDTSAARRIAELWPHKYDTAEQYLAAYIDANGGYGVFLKSTDQMVAWVIKHAFSHPAILQVEEEHKRKGYASLVMKVIAKEIGEEGYWPVCTVLLQNDKSINMFDKLGFKRLGTCTFIVL